MLIDGQFPVAAPPDLLLRHLFDARFMASCLPGCETLEPIDDDRYRAVVVIAMAGIRARFDLQVEVTQHDESNVWAVTRGEEGGNASTLQADSQITLDAVPEGTMVRYRSEVAVTGRLGRFALGMMKKKAQSLGEEFAGNLQGRLQAIRAEGPQNATGSDAAAAAASSSSPGNPAPPPVIEPVTPSADSGGDSAAGPSATGGEPAAAEFEGCAMHRAPTLAERRSTPPPVSPPTPSPAASRGSPRRHRWQSFLDWIRGGSNANHAPGASKDGDRS